MAEKKQEYNDIVYKKWMRLKDKGGFVTVQYWAQGGKVSIDIGTINANDVLVSNAKCYVKAPQFLAYLKADLEGYVTRLFPNFFSDELSKAGVTWYGGSTVDGQVISRAFKVTPYYNDPSARAFKAAWFEGKPTKTGAVIPVDATKPLRNESIKMSMYDIAELHANLNNQMIAAAVNNTAIIEGNEVNE